MEDLIENAQTLFDDLLPQSSPPLPPAPAGEPVPVISYGSSHTKITLPQSGEAQVADFTPQLPLRPTSSIHPSARCPPMSPSRMTANLSALNTSMQPTPPALPLKIQTSTDATEQPRKQEQTPDTSRSGEVKGIPDGSQDFVPPPTATREQYLEEQHSATESIPETPLTASSLASASVSRSVSE
jgi:hypothetical protein